MSLNAKLAAMMPMAYGEPVIIEVDSATADSVYVKLQPAKDSYSYSKPASSKYGPQQIDNVAGRTLSTHFQAGAFEAGGLNLGVVSDPSLSTDTQAAIITIAAGAPK